MIIKEIAESLAQEIQSRANKIFDKIPEIRESFCFSYYSTDSKPFAFFVNLDVYLCVDGISLYPENEEQEKECDILAKYFPFGDDIPNEEDKGLLIQDLLEEMFDDDFVKLLGAYIILSESSYSGNLIFYKDGRKFTT